MSSQERGDGEWEPVKVPDTEFAVSLYLFSVSNACCVLLSASPMGESMIRGDGEFRISRLSPPCSVHLPSQASLLFYPTLLHCFGKVALRLPLSKKGSLRRQDVFSQQIPASFTSVKTGRYGQRDYPFQSESPFQQDFMIIQVA